MNKKTVSILVVVVAILIIVLIVVGIGAKTAKAPVASNIPIASSTAAGPTSTPTSSSAIVTTLSTTSQSFYANKSFSLSYPNSWVISSYSPFSINNFHTQYLNGGIIPNGGAEIAVVTTTLFGTGSIQEIMDTELMGTTDITTTTLTVDGIACPAAADESAYAPGYSSKDVSVYCQRGGELWKMYLSYGASDTAMAAHVAVFNSMLASMKFLP